MDLDVTFDSSLSRLSFQEYMQQKINKAYAMLDIIKRNFICSIWIRKLIFCCIKLRPHVEYANSVGCPYKKTAILETEKVQK